MVRDRRGVGCLLNIAGSIGRRKRTETASAIVEHELANARVDDRFTDLGHVVTSTADESYERCEAKHGVDLEQDQGQTPDAAIPCSCSRRPSIFRDQRRLRFTAAVERFAAGFVFRTGLRLAGGAFAFASSATSAFQTSCSYDGFL